MSSAHDSQPRTAQILVVDDEDIARRSLSDILRLEGYHVTEADSGAAALAHLARAPVDLMLLDIKMPGMSGLDVLTETRRLSPETVVILLTAHGTREAAIQALRERAYDFLLKPSPPSAILESVQRGLNERREALRRDELLGQIEHSLAELKSDTQPPTPPAVPRIVLGGGILLDLDRRAASIGGEALSLTRTEFRLLALLVTNAESVLSPLAIVEQVQGYAAEGMEEARGLVRPIVSRLRRKLAAYPDSARCLVSVRGEGYMFSEKEG